MKKVITNNRETIAIEFVNNDSIIGFKNGNNKFFLSREEMGFFAIGKSNINSSSKAMYPNVRNCASQNHDECFVFDNHKDLFKWMSE